MDSRTQERVEQWDSRSFSGGYDGLADLAAADFSGAVDAAGTWLFMLNGRVVGVLKGAIEDFENASGTIYEAPHPSLPLLCTMEERGGDTRANYYTNETPLREVDGTLQDGSFTGYIELSENVLSGDYYAVYYGGRRMAAAYIGNSERLLTGDEAFERANDEVGIYEVIDVDIDVTDVPEPNASDSASTSAGSSTESNTEAESSVDAVSDAGVETKTEPQAEPSTDPTESTIESIDLSGSDTTATDETTTTTDAPIEDVTIDDTAAASSGLEDSAETDDLSGITASDDPDVQPPSSGITDAGLSTDADSDSSPSDDDRIDTGDDEQIDSEPQIDDPAVDDRTAATGVDEVDAADSPQADQDAVPETPAITDDERGQGDESSTESVPADAGSVDSDDGQSRPAGDTETADGSSPDLAEVEAAAQQLEQNNISWTEEDIESQSEDDASADEPTPDSDPLADTTDQSEPEPEENENEERFQEEAQWRETRSIPSIDPDNSETAEPKRDSSAGRRSGNQRTNAQQASKQTASSTQANSGSRETTGSSADSSTTRTQESPTEQQPVQHATQRTAQNDANAGSKSDTGTQTAADSSSGSAQDQRVAELTQRIETLEAQREKLTVTAEELEAERDQLRSENEELASTVDRLQSRIEELERELERTRQAAAGGDESTAETPSASTQLSPEQALTETNLFVRYTSKSQPTLETARDGKADRNEVASNLRLEHHTGFDAADTAVDGRPYAEFLPATMEYQFVDWLTEMVLYEIRDTGNADALGDLYDAIPRIDRAELNATISLEDDEAEDVPDQVTFDVVAFDKMGNPLVVANLNDSREPATQAMLESMEEAASAVKANYPALAAATVVTSSYFEPGALEVAGQATSGGFLSRGSKLSYVNLSRKQG